MIIRDATVHNVKGRCIYVCGLFKQLTELEILFLKIFQIILFGSMSVCVCVDLTKLLAKVYY